MNPRKRPALRTDMPKVRLRAAGATKTIWITLPDVKKLSPCELEILGSAIRKEQILGRSYVLGNREMQDVEASEFSFTAVHEILKARARKQNEREAMIKRVLAPWLEENGTDGEKTKFLLGVLDPDVVAGMLRAQLFEPFKGFQQYRMKASDICTDQCSCSARSGQYQTITNHDLPVQESARFESIKARARADSMSFEPKQHLGRCTGCQCSGVSWGVLVTTTYAGMEFVIEYSLDDPKKIAAALQRRQSRGVMRDDNDNLDE